MSEEPTFEKDQVISKTGGLNRIENYANSLASELLDLTIGLELSLNKLRGNRPEGPDECKRPAKQENGIINRLDNTLSDQQEAMNRLRAAVSELNDIVGE